MDVPAPEPYALSGLLVATAAELGQDLRAEHLEPLLPQERADVKYHQPDRLGDLLFNWFD